MPPKIDFSQIVPLLSLLGIKSDSLSAIIKLIEANKDIITRVLGLLQTLGPIVAALLKRPDQVPGPQPAPQPIPPPQPVPAPVPPAPPAPAALPLVGRLELKCFHASRFNQSYQKEIFDEMLKPNGEYVITTHDVMHFDCTPVDVSGNEIAPGDPRLPQLMGRNGDPALPKIQYLWTIDGSPSSDDQHFHLRSYVDDNGCTPALRLVNGVGPGRHRVEVTGFLAAADNAGRQVASSPVVFYCD